MNHNGGAKRRRFFLIPSKLYFFVYLSRLAPLFSVRGLRLGAGVSSDLILVSFLGLDLFLIFNLIRLSFPFTNQFLLSSFNPLLSCPIGEAWLAPPFIRVADERFGYAQ
jgi:hypothetical protein